MEILKIFDGGACSDIFELSEGTLLKAYKRKLHANRPVSDWTDHDLIVKAQFRAEAQAYENIQNYPELQKHTPLFFGRDDPNKYMLDSNGTVYIENCGIILERIPGRALKLAHLDSELEKEVSIVAEELRDTLRIDNVWDASCFVPGTRASFTLIDFALWDPSHYEMILYDNEILSNQERTNLLNENAD